MWDLCSHQIFTTVLTALVPKRYLVELETGTLYAVDSPGQEGLFTTPKNIRATDTWARTYLSDR